MANSLFMNRSVSPPQYTHLLSVIVLRLLIVPFVGWGGILSEILASFLLFYMTLLIIQSYRLPRSLFMLFVAISSIGFVLDMILTLGWVPMTVTPTLIVQVIYSFFLGSAAWLILQRLLQTSRVTMDTVKGGHLCLFTAGVYVVFTLRHHLYPRPQCLFQCSSDTGRLLSEHAVFQLYHPDDPGLWRYRSRQ
ncbi:MAG: hypothetical protein F6K00_09740 [Leptolyngbya sp. SIOISBB]|nr:hypothetical protein [Leptolyngbya sp. SIOISBB]